MMPCDNGNLIKEPQKAVIRISIFVTCYSNFYVCDLLFEFLCLWIVTLCFVTDGVDYKTSKQDPTLGETSIIVSFRWHVFQNIFKKIASIYKNGNRRWN